MAISLKKISLILALGGVALMFIPIWMGPNELMPVGVVLLVVALLIFNKAHWGTFFPTKNGHTNYDGYDSDSGFSGGGGDSGGGGASGDWDDD